MRQRWDPISLASIAVGRWIGGHFDDAPPLDHGKATIGVESNLIEIK